MGDVARYGLAIVGGVAGFFIGNPYLGFALGSTLGGVLFPGELPSVKQEGPRLSDLKVQSSSYGRGIPIVQGVPRMAGNLIWSTAIQETQKVSSEEVGGKGGGPSQEVTTTTYSYSASFAVGLCEGEISGIRKIWANGELIYNIGASADYETYLVSKAFSKAVRVYPGTTTQEQDSLILALEVDAPAYRDLAYVVFEDMQLARFGNRLPNLEFEVVSAGTNAPTMSYLDAQSAFGLYASGTITPDGNLLIWWATVDTGSDYVSRMAVVSPYTTQILREYKVENYIASTYAGFQRPAMNSRGDIAFAERFWGSSIFIWLAGSAPVSVSLEQATRIYADENDDFIFAARLTSVGANQYQLVRVPAGTTTVETIRVLADQPRDVALDWDGYVYVSYDSGVNGIIEKIRLADKVTVATYTNTGVLVQSVCPAGDGSVWFTVPATSGNFGIWRIPADFSAASQIYNHGGSFTGHTRIKLDQDWATGDILVAYLDNYKRYSASGTLLRTNTTTRGYVVVTDPRFPERIYAFNNQAASGGVNRFIAVDRKDNLTPNSVTLSSVLTDLCGRVGLTPSDIDVTGITDSVRGYIIANRMPASEAIAPLLTAFLCDAVESAGKIKFVKRGIASVATIPEADMGAHLAGGDRPDPQAEGRIQEPDLPREIALTYLDVDADYQPSTQYARRLVGRTVNDQQIQLPVVMSAAEARRTAEALLYEAWAARRTHDIPLSRKHARLEPGDPITLTLEDATVGARIIQKEEGQGLINLRTVGYDASLYTQTGAGATAPAGQSGLSAPIQTNLVLMDTALLREQDDTYGFYSIGGGVGVSTVWPGGKVFKSTDNVAFTDTGIALPIAGAIGNATTRLADFSGGNIFDQTSTVTVSLISGSLSSTTEANVLNGSNAAYLGGEVVQFTTATLISANTYTLSGLLRGRLGTEWAQRRHKIGERFALLDTSAVRRLDTVSTDVGSARWYKGVTFGTEVSAAAAQSLTLRANCLKPLAPVQITGSRDGSNNITINWIRRARKSAGWNDYIDVPLDEISEAYEADVFAGTTKTITGISQAPDGVISSTGHGYSVGNVIHITGVNGMTAITDREFIIATVPNANSYTVGEDTAGYAAYTSGGTSRLRGRTINVTAATASYTAAQQTTDYGSAQNPVYVVVHQMSSRVGRGYPGAGVI